MIRWVLFPGTGYHELYNGVVCNDTILATGVFSSKELWMLSKGTTLYFSQIRIRVLFHWLHATKLLVHLSNKFDVFFEFYRDRPCTFAIGGCFRKVTNSSMWKTFWKHPDSYERWHISLFFNCVIISVRNIHIRVI